MASGKAVLGVLIADEDAEMDDIEELYEEESQLSQYAVAATITGSDSSGTGTKMAAFWLKSPSSSPRPDQRRP